MMAHSPIKVAFIGAGGINFGSLEGPWNHSARLEAILGRRLEVTGLVEPSQKRRAFILDEKRTGSNGYSYMNTCEYDNVSQFLEDVIDDQSKQPHLVLIGIPPAYHGSTKAGANLEVLIASALPNVTLFVEKPMSAAHVSNVYAVGRVLERANTLVSVGYFMRYLKVVQKAKEIIRENNLTVMATVARYCCSYSSIAKQDWWMKSISCSPVVEQGTHFCDLSRYFGGDVDMDSVQAHAIEHHEKPGALSKVPVDEDRIPPEDRIPRMTAAVWKYKSGALGSFVHGINLQGVRYSCELEIHADGYMLRIIRPYDKPTLLVRTPACDEDDVYTFDNDDPYYNQIDTLVKAMDLKKSTESIGEGCAGSGGIASTWQDAAKTYDLTWRIRQQAEEYSYKR